MASQRLKHVYSGITVTSNDLASVVHHWRTLAAPEIHADRYRLDSIDELPEVLREEVAVSTVAIHAVHGERWLTFTWEPGYVLIEGSESDPRVVRPFTAVAEMLATKAKNGFGQCTLELSPAGSWRPPEETRSRIGQWFAGLFGRPRPA